MFNAILDGSFANKFFIKIAGITMHVKDRFLYNINMYNISGLKKLFPIQRSHLFE